MNKTRLRYLGLVLAVVPTAALAQGAGSDSGAMVGEVVVTAQKRAERLQDVPLTITAVSGAQLAAQGVTSTKELTKIIPGLIFAQNEATSQPSIRGVQTTVSTTENPVALYLDGVYQPAQAGGLMDLPDVARIEVLKGPQGTLFGRNATGGAIQIFTKTPTYEPSGTMSLSTGLYTGGSAKTSPEVLANGFFSTGLVPDKLAASVTGYYRYNKGYMTNDVTKARSGKIDSYGLRGRLLWEPTPDARVNFAAYYLKSTDYQNYNRGTIRGISSGSVFADAVVATQPWHVAVDPTHPNTLRTENYGASLRADFDTELGTLSSISGFSRTKNHNFVNSSGVYSVQCQTAFRCLGVNFDLANKSYSQEFDFVSKKFGMASITAGLFYFESNGNFYHVDVKSGATLSTRLIEYQNDVHTKAYAGFAEVNLDLTDRLRAILGGRYSHEKATADALLNGAPVIMPVLKNSKFTPRASVQYKVAENTNVYFTYSKGFKSGIMPTPNQRPLSLVQPETLNSYEVGFKTAQRKFNFNASYFHYDYKNLQLVKFDGVTAVYQNAANSKLDGFDVDGSYRATPDLTLSLAFNYMPRAKYVNYTGAPLFFPPANACGCNAPPVSNQNGNASGLRMVRTPKVSGTASVSWQHDYDIGKVGFNGSIYHTSSFHWDVIGTSMTHAYEDISAQVFLQKDQVRFTAFGKNLLNKAAIIGSQPSATIASAVYLPPRQIGLSVDYSF